MSLLLDTHAFLWFMEGNAKLSEPFDRSLVAQALERDHAIGRADSALDSHGVRRV